ncbi:hypothetical protein KGF56_001468 [Candida oxycetoniae]|uniref:Ist2p n=1 Tax=Candida oxycetoniae TaxID=497107 RepID=A0AAI9WYY9_9ASCO|nr:uncharacterized protein KGF56_001468 [Candida oxycetoniae]KAI3405861.2 hypothetical protein KGF56_001468 [Candida oxycetoniae]
MLPLQEIEPDFYISYYYPIGRSKGSSEQELAKVIEKLYDSGFSATIRPGDPDHLLIFIKLSSDTYIEQGEKDLIKNYEFGVTSKIESLSARFRIVYSYLTLGTELGGCGVTPGQGMWKNVESIVPITDAFDDTHIIEELKANFARTEFSTNKIKKVYGIKIALYFEFLKYYMYWISGLSILGLIQYFKKTNTFSLYYTFVNLLWGTFFITFWHRREQYLTNLWGVQNSYLIEEHLSELAQINKKFEKRSTYFHKDNSSGLRFIKELLFVPIALVFVAILISYQMGCFFIEIFLTDIYDGPGKSLLTLLPTVLISVFVPILTIVYDAVTKVVIKFEGHDNDFSKNNSILVKQFVLNFLTSYVPLIITSFLYLPFAHLVGPHLSDIQLTINSYVGENRFYTKYLTKLKNQRNFQINQGRLNAQYFYFIVTNQAIQIFLKYVLPLIITHVTKYVRTYIQKKPQLQVKNDNPYEAIWLHNVRASMSLPEYNVDNDFRSVILQYGYLIIFGPVWPLAPLFSLLFDILIFKLDNFKLLSGRYFKPPIPKRVDSIHPWNWALFLLTWLGSIISPVITAFYRHGTAPPKSMGQFTFDNASVHVSSSLLLVLLMFGSEHCFLILSYVLYKLSNLFKSDIEWENDFVDNDMKLRHDHYSNIVKPTIKVRECPDWKHFTPESTMDFQSPVITNGSNDADKTIDAEKIDSNKSGYSTSAQYSETKVTSRSEQAQAIAEKEKILREKQAELARVEKNTKSKSRGNYDSLNRDKELGDRIIESKSSPESGKFYSTIDNNKHINDDQAGASKLSNDKHEGVENNEKDSNTTTATGVVEDPTSGKATNVFGGGQFNEDESDQQSSFYSTAETSSNNKNSSSSSANTGKQGKKNASESKKTTNKVEKEAKNTKNGLKKLFNKI